MAKLPFVKRVFNSGEFSPKVWGRSDLDRYEGGVKTMTNMVPIPQGGVIRRPGTQYIATANQNYVRLIPFQFSQTQAYVVECGNGYMRFYMNGGQILSGNNAYQLNNISYATDNDLRNIQYAQSYDMLFMAHQDFNPKTLTRTAHNNWTFASLSYANNSMPSDWTPAANNEYKPRTVCFYQDRLIFGSNPIYPSRLWFSKTSAYNDFTTGTNDADGFKLNLLSSTADIINWIVPHKSLIAGGDSGIWSISAANGSTSPITPTNRKAVKDSYFGASAVSPALLGAHIIHAQYLSGKVRDLSYDYQSDGYSSSEASVLADHLFEGYSIREMAYQQSPFEIVWMLRSDGTLLTLTYLAEHKVIGWSKHTIGNVQSICCIPGTLETELWIATSRTVNGNNVTYIERLSPFYFASANNAFFVDCGLSGNISNTATVSGLAHLSNQTVQYWADGNKAGNATVSNNAITMAAAANYAIVGLPYTSELETLPIDKEISGYASSQHTIFQTKRITEIAVRCRNSGGGTYGPDGNNQTQLLPSNALYNGDLTNLSLRGGHGPTKTVVIKQTQPLPLAIDAIGMDMEI